MEGKRKIYTSEFKVDAVKMNQEKGVPLLQVSRDIGVDYSVLRRWKKEYLADQEQSFPGKGRLKARDEEVKRLQREVEVLSPVMRKCTNISHEKCTT